MVTSRRVFGGFLSMIGASAAACGGGEPRVDPAARAPRSIEEAVVHEEILDVLYETSGTVRGRNTAVMTSRTTGYVRSIEVRAGDRVARGQLLAVLEAKDVEASVQRARAGLEQALEARNEALSAVQAAEAQAGLTKTSHARTVRLYEMNAITQQQYDEAEAKMREASAQLAVSRARVRSAESRIIQAQAERAEAEAMFGYARILAPFAGRVIERRMDPGNLASPGMPILTLEEDGARRIEASIEESLGEHIQLGATATIAIDVLASPVRGVVSEVVPSIDVATRAFLVKIELPADVALGLRPGMYARVTFAIGRAPRLVVPNTAHRAQGALDQVFVVDGDRARLRIVTLGARRGEWTEVRSGLTSGERVVLRPPPALEDADRIEVAR